MSYIRAKLADIDEDQNVVAVELERPSMEANLDDEILDFDLELINEVNNLREGEALVVWKEIF